ncbi:MAG: glycosyltransferase family 9 protein [Kiloniellaceae bacterium]
MREPETPKILVIKLSALGDFVLSIGAFQAIRAHHRDARITLLTTKPFVRLAEACGCFDEIWIDDRPAWWQAGRWRGFARRLKAAGFDRVYDLQRSGRSGWYFRLAGRPRPEWVGSVPGCSHRYVDPPEPRHIAERNARMLALAGIEAVALPDLSFLTADVGRFGIARPYALLAPGSSPHRPAKRWPATRYAALARHLADRGITPVLLGTRAEGPILAEIAGHCPQARDLCGRTGLDDLAGLARGAALAVGNDTGPMHLIAAAGCRCLVLYSAASDPVKAAPRGPRVSILREASLKDLALKRVLEALEPLPQIR